MRHTHTMPRKRNVAAFLVGLGVWLAVLLLAFAAIQRFTDPISAQQTSTTAALPAPKNTMGVPGILCEPARPCVDQPHFAPAVRYSDKRQRTLTTAVIHRS